MGSEFPMSKMLYMLVRQASRPVAKRVRNMARRSEWFKKLVCLPPALVYMWSERVVDRLSRGGPPKEVPPYVEQKAVRLGANLIGEFVIFGTAAAFITLEFLRQKRKRQIKQQEEMLGKQALRQQAREAQYNRDRRTSELEDLKKQMEVLQQRLLAPETQKKMKNVEGEPDAASGIRIEDKYLASGVALRAQGGADEGQLERAAAKAASKIARAYGKDTQTVKKEAAAAALQKSKELKKAKEVKEQDLNVLDSAVTTVKDLGSVTAAELPKKTEQLKTMKKDQKRAEAVATQIIQQEDMEKKPEKENNSKLPKVEEMTDKEAEEVSEKVAEEAAKVALEKLDPDTGKLKQMESQGSCAGRGPQPPGEVEDQYADGQAARVWARFIGDASRRTRHYGAFLQRLLSQRGAVSVLDVACGTGVDSELLLEAGFYVTSCDASDQMLKHALRTRWRRRRDPRFDQWEIEEANWLTLGEDLRAALPDVRHFDAVICLGNSFAHMPTCAGDDPQCNQRKALRNFWEMVRPGGVLVVDHRNYDAILATGATPKSCFYYNNSVTDIRTSVVYIDGKPVEVAMDYEVGACDGDAEKGKRRTDPLSRFRLTYYPHRLEAFCALLREALGPAARHAVYADFRPTAKGRAAVAKAGTLASDGEDDFLDDLNGLHGDEPADEEEPAVYVHVLQKPL